MLVADFVRRSSANENAGRLMSNNSPARGTEPKSGERSEMDSKHGLLPSTSTPCLPEDSKPDATDAAAKRSMIAKGTVKKPLRENRI